MRLVSRTLWTEKTAFVTKPSIQAYLHWSLEKRDRLFGASSPGVRVASMDGHIPANLITLDKGMIRRFTGLDLQNDYFRQDLMEEQGLGGGPSNGSPLRASLPEGFYTFRVQALEAGTGREVSNLGETYFSVTSPLPPVINLPFSGAELMMSEPQRVNIQWMPRHYKLPGNITTYDLKVCKVPEGYEPTEALEACISPIIDDKANPGTFYPSNTGIGNSIIGGFERGVRYAARVTIHEFDINGDEVLFANEGRSEVTWFRYGTPCVSPETFAIQETGPGRLQLSWPSTANTKGYQVLYRKAGGSQWTTQAATGTNTGLSDLKPGRYELAVQAECTNLFPGNAQAYTIDSIATVPPSSGPQNPLLILVSTAGNPITADSLQHLLDSLKIPCASQISTYENCEAPLPTVNPTGARQLTTLNPGDVLSIYDMAVIVTSVSGGNELSGKGLAKLPFAQNVLTPVEFSGVKAYTSEVGTKGGCVYAVGNYFRTRTVSGTALSQEQAAVVAAVTGESSTDSSDTKKGFTGTMEDALEAIDSLNTVIAGGGGTAENRELLEDLRQTVVTAVEVWTAQINTQYANGTPAGIRADSIIAALNTINTGILNGSVAGIENTFKDIIDDFNHPNPPTTSALLGNNTATTPLTGVTLADLGACMNQVNGYNPLNTPGPTGLTCLGSNNGVPYWTYINAEGNTIYIVALSNNGTTTYYAANEGDWLECGRSPFEPCTNLWQPAQIQPGVSDPNAPNPLLPSIANVIPNPVGSTTATISWNGHSTFAKYIVTYAGGLQQEIFNTSGSNTAKINLSNLTEATNYSFTIDAYGADGKVMTSYKNGAFSTTTEKLAMPQNLRTSITNSTTVILTWDKDATHESYELVYTDASGDKHSIPATTNSITISGLDSTVTYPFTLVAKGKSATGAPLLSDPAQGTLTTKAAEPCSLPLRITATVNPDVKGFKLSWTAIPGQTGISLRYRKVQNPEALWTNVVVTDATEYVIKDLITKNQYEYRAKAICSVGTDTEEAGGFVTLTKTKVKPSVAYQCGKSKLPPSNNKTPLDVTLEVGDYILIGDFPAQIDRLETGSAPHRGLAHVLVPYLGMSNFLMEFTGLTVNTDYEVLAGEMHSVTNPVALAGIKQQNAERIKEQLEAVKQVIEDVKELAGQIADLVTGGKPVTSELQDRYNQKENEVIAELKNSDPDLSVQIEANKAERQAILDKYPVASADKNDVFKYLSDEDRAKYGELMQESKELHEKAKSAAALPEPPPSGDKDESKIEETVVTKALLYEIRQNCGRTNANQSATTASGEYFTICKSGDNRYYFYKQDDFWKINGVFYWENDYRSGLFYKYEDGKYVRVAISEGQYTLELLADAIRDLFFIKTPLILLSAGTSGTVTEFTLDQIGGVLLDKLQADGAIDVETNLLASLILGAVGSQSIDADQLKAMIDQIKTLAKKTKPEDLKRLIADVVEKWKIGAKKGVGNINNIFEVGDRIAGIAIKQIKQGSNGKYALIGRSMGNAKITGVRNVYSELKNTQKLDVEIFDASSLTGTWKTRFDDAIEEFKRLTDDGNIVFTNQELLQLKLYKLNKEWAQYLLNEGYTILDMGDFNNLGFSTFYAMEKSTIFL